jgi:hypothetical protein
MSKQLSSDILEHQFGPTLVEVIFQNDKNRLIFTRTVERNLILEISLVSFIEQGVKKYPIIHQSLTTNKSSMGKTFRQAGVKFIRQTNALTKQKLDSNFRNLFDSDKLATVLDVDIIVGEAGTPYANILEVYSPLVVWPVEPAMSGQTNIDKVAILNSILEDYIG